MNATLTITAYDMSVNGTAGATSQTSAAVTFGTFLKGDKGDKGDDGTDGVTPHIGSNGNWYIGTTDTLVKARATDGADGVTPHIGDNGNWFFGTTDSGVKARGTDGTPGAPGQPGNDGHTPTITATKQGTTTTILSDGVAIANIQDGQNGNDGNDADPLTITSQSLDADGNRVVVFSDGTSVTIPKGQQGDAGTTDYDQLTNKPTIPTKTSDLTNDSGFLTSHQDISTKLSFKETLANGNIVLTDGNGNEKQYMAATPSGDANHYKYQAEGAMYNDTGETIVRTADWGESVNHLPKRWYYNGIGDLTNSDVAKSYNLISKGKIILTSEYHGFRDIRFLFRFKYSGYSPYLQINSAFAGCEKLETIWLGNSSQRLLSGSASQIFRNCRELRAINGIIEETTNGYIYTDISSFQNCKKLQWIYIKSLQYSINFQDCRQLEKDCVLYMICNAANGIKDITITLHNETYNRLYVDSDIQAALTEKGHITLVSA